MLLASLDADWVGGGVFLDALKDHIREHGATWNQRVMIDGALDRITPLYLPPPPSMDTPQRTVMEVMQGYRVADAMRKLASITKQCIADGTYGETADTPAVVEN